jgi:carboxymethylenebutenolidase
MALYTGSVEASRAMMAGEWHPTLRQTIRGTLELALDTVAMPFSRKRAIQYTSAGQKIHGAIYHPNGDSRVPAVLLLPTAFGFTPHEHGMASRLAREGFSTLVIAYSKRTTGAVVRDNERRAQLELIVLDGWRALRTDPRVDANRSAVIGLSLGGYFGIHVATEVAEVAPSAVVVYYGVYDFPESAVARLRAPLLILQGDDDYTDFVTNAKRVRELSLRHGKACELVLYPGAGHQFDLFAPGSAATRDAWARTVAFLWRHLGPSPP